jgi:hypothetical protein
VGVKPAYCVEYLTATTNVTTTNNQSHNQTINH